MWSASISYFKIVASSFCWFFFFEEYLNPQIRIDKMVNEQSAIYQPSPLEFSLKNASSHILINSLGLYISQKYFFNFLSNLYIPSWLEKIFKFMVFLVFQITG